ncbi:MULTISPECIES: hypothetical protein [Bacillaceae]|uniref:Uncharacterized protein n=1 Tax=Oceanobacillus caeni TaxID=405946 RepID=A0ABR5ML19_9BACI|nr:MULTISPECIES: hypothetical protein [Bacillaceae]KPH76571.1 hypothetical protein AFL42_05695 [Oceanobacillus caeni]
MRFNQLISILQQRYSAEYEGYGQRKVKEKGLLGEEVESSYLEFFFLEDENWEEFLQRIIDNRVKDDE